MRFLVLQLLLPVSVMACGDKVPDGEVDPAEGGAEDTGVDDDGGEEGEEGDTPVDADGDGSPEGEDCDDSDPRRHPGATEVCSPDGEPAVDEDCDWLTDDADDSPDLSTATLWYDDDDRDGYGDPDDTALACVQPPGMSDLAGDCDDTRDDVHPDGQEVCGEPWQDPADEDCDGLFDDDDDSLDLSTTNTVYVDADGDGYGDGAVALEVCALPSGAVTNADDCDDTEALAYSSAEEACDDDVDNDCDGVMDCDLTACEVHPSCYESDCSDGVDNDGDGLLDCEDGECMGDTACVEETCDDGLDEDGDGDTDCDDEDCWGTAACVESVCDDGVDDDGDGAIDCDDSDCAGEAVCRATVLSATVTGGAGTVTTYDGARNGYFGGTSLYHSYFVTYYRKATFTGITGTLQASTVSGALSSCTWQVGTMNWAYGYQMGWDTWDSKPGKRFDLEATRSGFRVNSGCAVTTSAWMPHSFGVKRSALRAIESVSATYDPSDPDWYVAASHSVNTSSSSGTRYSSAYDWSSFSWTRRTRYFHSLSTGDTLYP